MSLPREAGARRLEASNRCQSVESWYANSNESEPKTKRWASPRCA